MPVALHFENVVRVAGETLHGHVDLDVAEAQKNGIENLRIKFRGSIHTQITKTNGRITLTHKQTLPLLHSDQTLWTQGRTFPEPGSHLLSCPFHLELPENLPPSFHCMADMRSATISYSVEVVGDRPGLFKANDRLRQLIAVVPAASQSQLQEHLRRGWPAGRWKDTVCEQKMRQHIWGDYSQAQIIFALPDLPSFPIASPIQFRCHIVTYTKEVDSSPSPEDKHGKPLFPAPPADFSEISLDLIRITNIRIREFEGDAEDCFNLRTTAVRRVVDAAEWIPKNEEHGSWKRTTGFESTISMPYAPTTSTETVEWKYKLRITVPFPGIGNDVKLEVPIRLDPVLVLPPRAGALDLSSIAYENGLPGPKGLVPVLEDLPPSYWAGENSEWDEEDSKKN
ncbi:hypothetical protein C8J57DRAFT_1116781 [Mycena rebaudengoi]|nr:hypothetical protein C8J57DRAFT_1116781 [Mycena rebaudengoi]